MVNIVRPSKFALALNIVLCIFALTTTIYAVNLYLWEANQRGGQEVLYAVEGSYSNFTLPRGYVDVPSYATASPSPVLTVTTHKENLILQISCTNYQDLAGNYSDLRLDLMLGVVSKGTLDLRTDDVLNFSIALQGTYHFDYRISYTPIAQNNNEILLHIDVIQA